MEEHRQLDELDVHDHPFNIENASLDALASCIRIKINPCEPNLKYEDAYFYSLSFKLE
jgi:hypothetical protein